MNSNENSPDEAIILSAPEFPKIGFLTESLNSLYQSDIWIGASDTAIKFGYTLICFAGGSLYKSSWNEYEPQRNTVYQFIDKNKLSGMVIAGSLGNFISVNEFEKFYNQFVDLPLVCLGPEISSVPTIIVDNTHGMRQLISHLVEKHNCRRIAFVRGPEGNQEAEERLRIFQDVLIEHGITPDQKLIIRGDFSRDAGVNAVEYLVHNELKFDAFVGANDDTALGALKCFQEHHIRVPEDVLVFGFDDIEESSFSAPPLTTVRQPLYEIGSKSIEVIHNCILGDNSKGTLIVPAKLVTRQSCGCFKDSGKNEEVFHYSGHTINDEHKLRLHNEIEWFFKIMTEELMDDSSTSLLHDLVDAFIDEVRNNGNGQCVYLINTIAWKLGSAGGDIFGLYRLLSIMRKFASSFYGCRLPDRLERMFQNGYVAIADSVNRIQAHRRLSSERSASILRKAGQEIASAFDLSHLIHVIAIELSNLEIDECYISLFDNEYDKEQLTHLQLILALQNGIPQITEKMHTHFKAPAIAPQGIMRQATAYSLLVEPLYFKNEQIGIIVFNVNRCRDGSTYEILQQHISSALKGALLMKKVQEQSVALEQANVQLQKLRDAEHAYLEAIKRELELGREIQSSFFPRSIPDVPGWEIVTEFQPAREVSGDFYDIFLLPNGNVVMIICDVSGKDVSAALYMALIRTLVRALAEQALKGADEPLDAIRLTNNYLINHHFGSNGRYMYATLFMAVLNPVENVLRYVNAGHNPPAIVIGNKVGRWIRTTGPAIGIIPEAKFGQMSCSLEEEEILFMYTDGVTEAKSPSGELFSKERLISQLSLPTDSAITLINRIKKAVRDHSADTVPFDDITMIALKNCYN